MAFFAFGVLKYCNGLWRFHCFIAVQHFPTPVKIWAFELLYIIILFKLALQSDFPDFNCSWFGFRAHAQVSTRSSCTYLNQLCGHIWIDGLFERKCRTCFEHWDTIWSKNFWVRKINYLCRCELMDYCLNEIVELILSIETLA